MSHRIPRRPIPRLVTLIVVSAFALVAACGGGGQPPVDGAPAAASVPASATGTPEPVASTASTPTLQLPRAVFISGQARTELPIEVPPEREYGIGLSGRHSLEGRGMLFSFPDGANTGFWMKGTHIDLDIAFIDSSMTVTQITTMRANTLDIHRPPTPYIAAIEAPAGWYAASGITVGAQVTVSVDLKAATGR
jgi:uncharacterized membrane protein (UPF0127 family)